jgi:hypothetical protein
MCISSCLLLKEQEEPTNLAQAIDFILLNRIREGPVRMSARAPNILTTDFPDIPLSFRNST